MAQTLGTPAQTSGSASGFDRALKEMHAPRINMDVAAQINAVLGRLKRSAGTRDLSGRRFYEPINIRGSQALGARSSSQTASLPTAQNQVIVDALVPPKYLYGVIQFDLPTIKASRNDATAFARVADVELDGLRRDAIIDENRQYLGNGIGSLGTISVSATVATTALVMHANHRIKPGMVIDLYTNSSGDPSTTKRQDSETVSNVDGTTVTLAATATWLIGYHAVREDNRGNEVTGIRAIVSASGTYMGLSRSTYPEWGGTNVAAGGEQIDDDLVMQLILTVQSRGRGKVNLILSDYTQFRRYGMSITGDRRYTTSMILPSGFVGLQVANAEWLPDVDHVPVTVTGLDTSTITVLEMTDGWEFDDTDGRILHRKTGSVDYEVILVKYEEIYSNDPKANGSITGLAA